MHNDPAQIAQPIVDVRIPTAHGELKAALARPADSTEPVPGVIVLHELFGLNNDIRRIAEQFSDHGYAALAPDLYSVGPALKPICIRQTMNSLRQGSGRPFDLIEAGRAWLADRDDVDQSRLAVAGFCMGGGFAMLFAARAPLGAAAVFYGQAPRSPERLQGICPTFGAYGEEDHLAPGHGDILRGHLEELNVEHEVIVYPGTGHSFMNRHDGLMGFMVRRQRRTVGYQAESAESAWNAMLDFFDTHLDGTTKPVRS